MVLMEKTILILEDEREVANLYSKFLTTHGYKVVVAHDGNEGLDCLKKIKPDIILLDLSMPNMDGIEFYKYIKGLNGLPRYPVLVLTARLDLAEVFKNFQVDGILSKPFAPKTLLHEIEIILNHYMTMKQEADHKKIVIIDDDKESSDKIAKMFSEVGYVTTVINSGYAGIDKISINPPDLAVVSLSLQDLPGDLVILKLQEKAQTRHIKYILYVRKNFQHEKIIMEGFSHKTGVKVLCEYSQPIELLEAVVKAFSEVHGVFKE